MEAYLRSPAMREESREMWNLNKRLEAYLSRVQSLEEENELLRAEIQEIKGSQAQRSWRSQFEEEVGALRDALNDGFREKTVVELERDSLLDEIEQVKGMCQRERQAQEDAKKELAEDKKALEEERRAQMWLKEKALQLEHELEALVEVHEADRAELEQEIATFSQSMENFRVAPVAYQPVDVEDYSQRLSAIWKGAVDTYKSEVSSLEASLDESKQKLHQVVDENRQNQAQLQSLEKELSSFKARKAMLEERLAREWQDQQEDIEQFQVDMDSLEEEKQALRTQIAHVLEDRQQLMHLKMSLSLEVATYRSLLEAESTRMLMPYSDSTSPSPFRESPDARKYPKESRYSSSAFQKVETKSPLQRNQHRFPPATMSSLSKSPLSVTDQTPKVRQVLQSQNLKYTNASAPPKSAPELKGKSANLSSPRCEEAVTNIKVEAVSKTKLASLDTAVDRPSKELELDVAEDVKKVTDSNIGQKTDEQSDKLTHQEGLEEINGVKPRNDPRGKDHIDEAHPLNEDSALQEELYPNKILKETLEENEKKVEDEEELLESKINVANTQASLMKAMGATFDIPSYDALLDEEYGTGLPHLDSLSKEAEKPDETEKQIETGEQAVIEVSREAFLEPMKHQEESAKDTETDEPVDIKDTHEEEAEHSLVAQEVYEENQLSDIPSAGQPDKIEIKDEIGDFEISQYQNEELKMQSKKNEEISDLIVEQVEHLLENGSMVCLEDEWDRHKVSMDGHDIPKDTLGGSEESYRLETPTEAKETMAFQMTEEENLRELASAAEDTEDYDAVSDVQESMFFKTESLSAEGAELTEVMPNETLENTVADQLMPGGGEREEDMLTDTEDFTEDLEIDDGMEEITEHEIQSVRISENFSVNENIREPENTDLFDNVEGPVNLIHDNDIWKRESSDVAELILQDTNLNAEDSHLENEIKHAKEIASEPESLSHETLGDNERILSQESMGQKHDENLISQEEPLVVESELVIKTESASMHSIAEPLNDDLPQGLRGSDDFLISAEKMQWGDEQDNKTNLDLSDETPANDSEELLQMENVTEHIEFNQYIKFEKDQISSEEHMSQNKAEHKDPENDESSIANSYKEISEAETEALSETQIIEEHKVGVSEDNESKEATEEQEGVKILTSTTDTYQMKSEFVEFGVSVDAQPEFSDQITESEICGVTKQELEDRNEYSLEETLPDTSLLPRYDEETETSDLELQESVELLTQVKMEPDFIKVYDQSHQDEFLHVIESSTAIVQNDVSGDLLGMNEHPEDLNNVAFSAKETSKQDIIEDESFVHPEQNQEEENIPEYEEDNEQEDLVSSTHVTEFYQMQSQYSESEDSIDSQNALLQDISQTETSNVDMQEQKNTNDYPLGNNLPDTVLTLNRDDETEIPSLKKQLHVEMLTQVNKEKDIIHGEETQVEQMLVVEETPVSLEATQLQTESTLSKIAAKIEKEIVKALKSEVETTENQEENNFEDLDSQHNGFIGDFKERRYSATGQEIVDEALEYELSTNAITMSKQDEELFEEVQDKSLEDPKGLIVENEAMKANAMGEVCQERFDDDETEAEGLVTEITTGSSLTLTQDEGHFPDITDESTEQTQDVIEKSESFKVSEITDAYQEMFENDVPETFELDSEFISSTVTLLRKEESDSKDLGVELSEQAKNVFEESDDLKQSELKEINHDMFPCVETNAEGLESAVPSSTDTLSVQVEGNFENFSLESQVQENVVTEEGEDLKASHVRNHDQENVEDRVTESEELESERASDTAKLSMQKEAHIENVDAESVEYSEKPFEEKTCDKVTEMIDTLQEKCENDERDIERLTSETVTNTVRMSMDAYGVSEDVPVEATEFSDSATEEGKVLLASEQGEIYQEKHDNENFGLEFKSEQNVTNREFDALHIPGDELRTGSETVLEQGSAEDEHQNASALTTIDNKSEPDRDSQRPELFHSDSEDSLLSEEESPNVTKTDNNYEHEIIMSSGSDLTRVSSEANESTELLPSTESKDAEYKQEMVAEECGEQMLISHQDVFPVSNIDNLCKDTDYATKSDEGLSEQLPETADESVESIDVLAGESEMEASEERFVIKHENFLLTPMQFTSESHILEENGDGLNGFHSTLDIDDPPTFRKEMLNGHSSVDESQETDLINQEGQEPLENNFKGQPQSDSSPKTVFIHEAYAEETFAFPKTDESQNLFQKLLGASNQQETSHIEEDHVHSSEEEPTSEDDHNGNANASPDPFTQGNDWGDLHQQASKKAAFEDGQSLFERNQPSTNTLDSISGLKISHDIDDAWSSDED